METEATTEAWFARSSLRRNTRNGSAQLSRAATASAGNSQRSVCGESCSAQRLFSAGREQHRTVELMKLLIVEDNDRMRSLIRRTVADLAETIHECSDGA